MKKITAILITILLSATLAHANLIDLTPGGFGDSLPFPPAALRLFGAYGKVWQNLAGASIVNGQPDWSTFTLFGHDHFGITFGGATSSVTWDLTGTGYRLNYVLIESAQSHLSNLYTVGVAKRFNGDGTVELNGVLPTDFITFVGTNHPLPDTGSTLILLGVGMPTVIFLRRRICT